MMEPDADHRAGADDHAEHGEEGAHLVLADGGEGQADAVHMSGRQCHFSTLSASMGSSWAARCAG